MIPVSVDTFREERGIRLVRCSYFNFEESDRAEIWSLGLPDLPPVPFHLLSLEGVLLAIPAPDWFSSPLEPDGIVAVLDRLEAANLIPGSASIWLSNDVFGDPSEGPPAGDVFWINLDLFQIATRYMRGEVPLEVLLEFRSEAIFSPKDTADLARWGSRQLELAAEESVPPTAGSQHDAAEPEGE